MKRNYLLLFFILIGIAVLSGNLTAGMSWVGHIGINFFFKQYGFLKSWWHSALICLGCLLIVGAILFFIDSTLSGIKRKTILLFFFVLFLSGLYFTFRDFRQDLSHRWMGERFHVGIYLYWIGACIISLFFALTEKNKLRDK